MISTCAFFIILYNKYGEIMNCYPVKKGFYQLALTYTQELSILFTLEEMQKNKIFEKVNIEQIKEAYYRLYDIHLLQKDHHLSYQDEYQEEVEEYDIYHHKIVIRGEGKRMIALLQRLYPYIVFEK